MPARPLAVAAALVLLGACGASEAAGPAAPPVPVAGPAGAEPSPTSSAATTAAATTEAPTTVAPTTAAPTTLPAPALAPGETLPELVAPIDPPSGSGPVPTDPVRLPDNPSRPVGVPLLPGEQGYLSCQVSIVGDSLTVAGSGALADALRANGCAAVSIAAKGGANTRYGVRLATDLRDAGLLTSVVLVNMGTNDCAADAREIDGAIDEMMRVLGPDRLVVWPTTNISRTTPYCEPNGDLLANERILAAGSRYANIRNVDWWGVADQHPEWHPDGVHHNREGMRAWAYVLATGVSQAVTAG